VVSASAVGVPQHRAATLATPLSATRPYRSRTACRISSPQASHTPVVMVATLVASYHIDVGQIRTPIGSQSQRPSQFLARGS
jgi:hypothetical protein